MQRALREAFLCLPEEEYDWFDIHGQIAKKKDSPLHPATAAPNSQEETVRQDGIAEPSDGINPHDVEQKEFFEFAGPLFSVMISPRTSVVSVGKRKEYRAICRDRSRRMVFENLVYRWKIADGEGELERNESETVTFVAPPEPCLTTLRVIVLQGERECADEALITITDSLLDQTAGTGGSRKGLPGYTYHRAPGEMWRSKYDGDRNVVVINNGHRDFVYAGKQKSRKLRYICRLFCKELVLHNFPGLQQEGLLERMIELSMYTEENLK